LRGGEYPIGSRQKTERRLASAAARAARVPSKPRAVSTNAHAPPAPAHCARSRSRSGAERPRVEPTNEASSGRACVECHGGVRFASSCARP